MSSSIQKYLDKILNVVLIIAIIITTLGFFSDLQCTIQTGGADLRNRVVGARLLSRGLDPYYYKWTPGEDEKLLDPLDKPELPFSRVTVPPSILLLHLPLANLSYFPQRIIWLFLQWIALMGSYLLLIKTNLSNFRLKCFSIASCLFIFGNNFWRLHVGVGQIYVFYVLLLSLAYWVSQSQIKNKQIIVGCLIGFTASIRLPIIVIILPMIIFKKFKLMAATLSGFFLSLIAFYVFSGQKVWASYFSAMSKIGKINSVTQPHNVEKFVMPKIIEGMNNLTELPVILFANTSIQGILKSLFNFSVKGNILIVACCIFLLIFSIRVLFIYQNQQSQTIQWDILFMIGNIMILVVDFFIPAPRYSYNNIQLLIPLFLLSKNIIFSSKKSITYVSLLILGLSLVNGMFIWIPKAIKIGELIIVSSLLLLSLTENVLFSDTKYSNNITDVTSGAFHNELLSSDINSSYEQ